MTVKTIRYAGKTMPLDEATKAVTTFRKHADGLRAIAVRDGRPLTSTEASDVKQYDEAASGIERSISDEQIREQVKAFGAGIGLGEGHGNPAQPAGYRPASMAGGEKTDTRWSAAALKQVDPQGYAHTKAGLLASGSIAVPTAFSGAPVREGARAEFLRQLIPTQRLDGTDRYAFMRQTVRTNNATAVARGQVKPTSRYTVERVEDRARVIAHLSEPIYRSDLADSAALAQFLDLELRLGVLLAEDAQLLAGDGTGENMAGILNTPGILAIGGAGSALRILRKSLTQLQLQHVGPTAWVMNPQTWEDVEMLRDASGGSGTQTGGFLLSAFLPTERADRKLFGLPVLVTDAIDMSTVLLGDFAGSALVYEREQTVVTYAENLWQPSAAGGAGANTFATNELVFRAESRLGLAVTRPAAFIEVDLSDSDFATP